VPAGSRRASGIRPRSGPTERRQGAHDGRETAYLAFPPVSTRANRAKGLDFVAFPGRHHLRQLAGAGAKRSDTIHPASLRKFIQSLSSISRRQTTTFSRAATTTGYVRDAAVLSWPSHRCWRGCLSALPFDCSTRRVCRSRRDRHGSAPASCRPTPTMPHATNVRPGRPSSPQPSRRVGAGRRRSRSWSATPSPLDAVHAMRPTTAASSPVVSPLETASCSPPTLPFQLIPSPRLLHGRPCRCLPSRSRTVTTPVLTQPSAHRSATSLPRDRR